MKNAKKLHANWLGMLLTGGMLVLVCQSFAHGQEGAEPGSSLFTMNADGSEVELLADGGLPGLERMGSPHWSPDGKQIVSTFLINDELVLARVKISGASESFVPLRKGPVPQRRDPTKPVWSPDGRTILFADLTGNILSIPASPFASTEATLLFSQDGVRTRNAVWSPDSQKIVFVHRKIGLPKTDVAQKADEK